MLLESDTRGLCMSEEFDFDKKLAPVATHLVSGRTKQATVALTGILTKFFTGSPTLAGVAEATLAKAMTRSSQGKLDAEYQKLAEEEKAAQLKAYLASLFREVETGQFVELEPVIRKVVAEEGESTRRFVDTRSDKSDSVTNARADEIIAAIRALKTVDKSAPAPIIHLPYVTIGDLFKGRDGMLDSLRTQLQKRDVSAITQMQAVHGLGGVGKTRLAVEYGWRCRGEYNGIFFVGAASPQLLNANLARLTDTDLLNLDECCDQPEPVQVAAVMKWLRTHKNWLMILDNIDDDAAADAVDALLPRLQGGHVIITSRLSRWGAMAHQQLDAIPQNEAKAFILARTTERTQTETDDPDASRLAEQLGSLPLALEQASAYINRNRLSLSAYLNKWEKERDKLLQWSSKRLTKYPDSIAVTWKRTFDDVSPAAQTILMLCAFFAPNDIPIAMLESQIAVVQEALALLHTGEAGPIDLSEALAELDEYSLIGRTGEYLSVHKMVQEVMRSWIGEDNLSDWTKLALKMVKQYAPSDPPPQDVRSWPIWEPLRPHAERVIEHRERVGADTNLSVLANNLGVYLKTNALYDEAEPLYRGALEINEASLGKDHPEVAIRLNNLASLLQATNRLEEAEPLMRRALEIFQQSLGRDHPNVAVQINNLAQLLKATNRLEEAESLMRRVLEIFQESMGSDHPNVATSLNNVAALLKETHRLNEAEPLMRRALDIFQVSLGGDHPSTKTVANNLAILVAALNAERDGELKAAE